MSNQRRQTNQTKPGGGRKKTSIGIAREEALAAGMSHFNGSVCSVDPRHGTIRRVSNNTCVVCSTQHNKDRRDRERINRPRNTRSVRVNMSEPGFCWPVTVIGDPDRVRNER
ncbi:hypothetical protein PEp14_00058 [Erwinia phage PEp14]|uniref:Uncharacterized protein n=1 Tax=Erwinia phage PEp14 TaxID=1131315 RepID=H2DE88_9CAUD|nr:hypothetical protein PEp14_00058 [Erwinia phage PEp14]AEY69647.1 hypothetical protein PEp14_00058 [Erwinia phage PEp14]